MKKINSKIKNHGFRFPYENCFIIAFFFSCFWTCNTTTARIFYFDSSKTFLLSFFNLLLFALFFVCQILFFTQDKSLFDIKFDRWAKDSFIKPKYLWLLLELTGIQLIFDFLGLGLETFAPDWWALLINGITILKWFIIVFLLLRNRENPIQKQKSFWLIALLIGLLIFIIFFLKNLQILSEHGFWEERLDPQGDIYLLFINYFNHRLIIINIVVEAITVIFFSILKNVFCPRKYRTYSSFVKSFLRVDLFLGVFLAFFAVHFFVFPYRCISKIDASNTTHVGEGFNADQDWLYLRRREGYSFDQPFYFSKKVTIKYGDNIKFDDNDTFQNIKSYRSFIDFFNSNVSSHQRYTISGLNVDVYEGYAICYYQEKPIVVLFDEIKGQSQSEILTAAIKEILLDGNAVLFDYSAEYLKKYDPDTLYVYAERYREGDFTPEEQEWIHHYGYKKEFLMHRAEEILK